MFHDAEYKMKLFLAWKREILFVFQILLITQSGRRAYSSASWLKSNGARYYEIDLTKDTTIHMLLTALIYYI